MSTPTPPTPPDSPDPRAAAPRTPDAPPVSRHKRLIVVAICAFAIILDGYDLTVYGAVVPSLLEYGAWDLTETQAGALGSYALMGMLLGALLVGTVTDLVGRRRIIIGCVIWFSAGMALTAFAPSPEAFGLLRFLTGLGLGGVIPTAIALTMEYAEPHRRNMTNAFMFSGYAIGGICAAMAAIPVLARFEWQTMFWIGALPALVLVPLAASQGALRAPRGQLGTVTILAAVQVAGPFLLIALGEHHISSALAGLAPSNSRAAPLAAHTLRTARGRGRRSGDAAPPQGAGLEPASSGSVRAPGVWLVGSPPGARACRHHLLLLVAGMSRAARGGAALTSARSRCLQVAPLVTAAARRCGRSPALADQHSTWAGINRPARRWRPVNCSVATVTVMRFRVQNTKRPVREGREPTTNKSGTPAAGCQPSFAAGDVRAVIGRGAASGPAAPRPCGPRARRRSLRCCGSRRWCVREGDSARGQSAPSVSPTTSPARSE